MPLDKDQIRDLYRRRAGHYDASVVLYYLLGFRVRAYRERAVSSLELRPGSTVVDLGCGTGLNFGLLRDAVGPDGRVIGVDLTPAMLERAADRIARHGWDNVALIKSDVAEYRPPPETGGILSTFALTIVPEYARVIDVAYDALTPGARLALLDFKEPPWPPWLVRLFAVMNRPFGVTMDLADLHPWEAIKRGFDETRMVEFYSGLVYLAVGEKGPESAPASR